MPLNFVDILNIATAVEIRRDTIQPYIFVTTPDNNYTIANSDEHGFVIEIQHENYTSMPY